MLVFQKDISEIDTWSATRETKIHRAHPNRLGNQLLDRMQVENIWGYYSTQSCSLGVTWQRKSPKRKLLDFWFNPATIAFVQLRLEYATLESMPLLTEISDVTKLHNVTFASAITAIKIADLEKQCLLSSKRRKRKNGTNSPNSELTTYEQKLKRLCRSPHQHQPIC